MVLEQEAIEQHKLSKIIQCNNGFILDLSTDCISCVFPNEFPFQVDDKQNIKNYYYDTKQQFPRYKLENKPEGYRLTCEKLPNYTRTDKFIIKNVFWNKLADVSDNNFHNN